MSEAARYLELLDSTIAYLSELKAQGVRHVPVDPGILRALGTPIPRAQPSRATMRIQEVETLGESSTAARSPAGVASVTASPPTLTSVPPAAEATGAATAYAADTDKAAAMAVLRERALACTACPHLASSRKNVVFGVGDIHARLMFVGEAPGADEDVQGEPFVGRAGELLTRIIQTMGLSRETVYIANVLKCRPDTPGQRYGNRKPTPEEMHTCLPFLEAQIDLIRPQVLVALGGTALEGLLGRSELRISALRGRWQSYRDIPLMPTFHPSYLLRNESDTIARKRLVWEDILQVMEKLELPISEKQRNFFRKSS